MPAPQAEQPAEVVLAATSLYRPTPQLVHADAPAAAALYVPAAHGAQTAEVAPAVALLKVPAAHAVQSAEDAAALVSLYFPPAQLVHTDVPVVTELYVPAAHAVHAAGSVAPTTAL